MIRDLLQKHRITPDTDQDQHFLDDETVLQQEVQEAEIDGSDIVLEIGGGLGSLTKKLAEKAGQVYVIEKDPRLIDVLEDELDGLDNIEIIEGDALEVDWPGFDRCVSNPPYHLSSELIERLGEEQKLSVLSLQKAFAERLVAEPGSSAYSSISIRANYHFIPVFLQTISRDSFYPPPEVKSALVKLYPRKKKFGIHDEDVFFTVVKALFTNKRKKVRNAFVDARHILGIDKDAAKAVRDDLPYSEERVINLEMKQLAELANYWAEHDG